MSAAKLPRNTTRQAESPLYGRISQLLNRITGVVIVAFVLVHTAAQAVLHAPMFASAKASAAWLPVMQSQNWVHALLFFSIVFHTVYGLRLLAADFGWTAGYRFTLWFTLSLSAVFAAREVLRYVGV